ncbi:MAG: chemotaxis protein CheA [Pseudomonadota bacterium]
MPTSSIDVLQEFVAESTELLDGLIARLFELQSDTPSSADIDRAYRDIHTLKGGAGFLSLEPIVSLCHVIEEVIDPVREGRGVLPLELIVEAADALAALLERAATGDEMVIPLDLVDRLRRHAQGEALSPTPAAVMPKNVLDGALEDGAISDDDFEALLDQIHGANAPGVIETPKSSQENRGTDTSNTPRTPSIDRLTSPPSIRVKTAMMDELLNLVGELVVIRNRLERVAGHNNEAVYRDAVSRLSTVTDALKLNVGRARLQPATKLFNRYRRKVQELATSLDKAVQIEFEGEATELDQQLIEALADPLVHLLRNAIDHGIESPSERAATSKPTVGRLTLSAHHAGERVRVSLRDDGRGIDPHRLRTRAQESGWMDAQTAEHADNAALFALIFEPGFSTVANPSTISGRGVGMDVVRANIEQIGGAIHLSSTVGEGTEITIEAPLTLAIANSFIVGAGGIRLAIPTANVSLIAPAHELIRGSDAMKPDELVCLATWLGEKAAADEVQHVLVVELGVKRIGFLVDNVLTQEDVVIKPIGRMMNQLPGIGGATLTGEGELILILDPSGFASKS